MYDINGNALFSKLSDCDRKYICCHHINGALRFQYWILPQGKTIFNSSIDNIRSEHLTFEHSSSSNHESKLYISLDDYYRIIERVGDHMEYLKSFRPDEEIALITFPTFIPANIELHYNLFIDGEEYHSFTHPENDLYWIDHLENGELLMEPPTPYVEGQTFLGWYKDKECIEVFDFENEIVHEKENEIVWLHLYAKWQ